jgi:uncharacterized iron-regulated protein
MHSLGTVAWALGLWIGSLPASFAQDSGWLDAALGKHNIVVLGELHDSAPQHAARLAWLKALPASRRIVLGLEQLDVDRQSDIDKGQSSGMSARALAQAAGFRFDGWQWELYEPVVQLALDRGWPIVALNLPSRLAMAAARLGPESKEFQAPGLPGVAWPGFSETEVQGQKLAIEQGHCGLMPQAMLPAMMRAQQARDATMAAAAVQARRTYQLPVVALVGNGHARKDWGLPRFVSGLEPTWQVFSLAMVEPGDTLDSASFDRQERFPAQARPDPCEELKKRFGAPAKKP